MAADRNNPKVDDNEDQTRIFIDATVLEEPVQ